MRDFKLRIMASDHTVYDGPAKSVTLPTPNGSIGVMAQHVNYITAVVPGEVSYIPSESAEGTEAGQKQHVIVSDGILKVENGEAIILVDTAETPAEICDITLDRMELRVLRTADEYLTEAQQNANCVASYVERTLRGGSWVCSFRPAGSDTTLLTIEVNEMGKMCQIKGRYNREPYAKELRMLVPFQKRIFSNMEKMGMEHGMMPAEMAVTEDE